MLREEIQRLRADNKQLVKENTTLQCQVTELKTMQQQQDREIRQLRVRSVCVCVCGHRTEDSAAAEGRGCCHLCCCGCNTPFSSIHIKAHSEAN